MKISKSKIIILFLILLLCCSSTVLSFTEEEQAEIDSIVSTLVANSQNNGVTWGLGLGGSGSGTKVAFFETDFSYEGQECKYLAVMYWNNQFTITLTDGVLNAKHNTGEENEFCQYYYNSNLELINAKTNSFSSSNSGSVAISGVNSYFYSEFTIKNNSGEVVEPFFLLTPQATLSLVEVMEQEREQVATMKEIMEIIPLIIVILVSSLGLRKALTMLYQLLTNS